MKVGFISPVSAPQFGGVERYASNLLEKLADDPALEELVLVNFPASFPAAPRITRLSFDYGINEALGGLTSGAFARLTFDLASFALEEIRPLARVPWVQEFFRQVVYSLELDRNGPLDIVHGLSHFSPRFVRHGRLLMTVHDIGPLARPELFEKRDRAFMSVSLRNQIRRASHVITDSLFTRDECETHFGIPRSQITVVPLGVGEEFQPTDPEPARSAYGLTRPFVLYPIGTIEPRKNIEFAIRLAETLAREGRVAYDFVLTGRFIWSYPRIETLLREAHERGVVRFLGYVPLPLLSSLYSGAEACLYPSLYEGFGLPVLEAMACAGNVICSDLPSLREFAGNAAILLDPEDLEAWKETIYQLATDRVLRDRVGRQGRKAAGELSWDRTARQTVQVYEALTE